MLLSHARRQRAARIALVAAVALLAVRSRLHAPFILVDSRACPGVTDVLAVQVMRLLPDTPVARWLPLADAALAATFAALLVVLAARLSGSILIAAALGAAAAIVTSVDVAWSVLPSAAYATLALAAGGFVLPSAVMAIAGAGLGAAAFPESAPLASVALCLLLFGRNGRDWNMSRASIGILSAGVLIAGIMGPAMMPDWTTSHGPSGVLSCVAPAGIFTPLATTHAAIASAYALLGPYASALALAGMSFGLLREHTRHPVRATVLAAALFVFSSAAPVAGGHAVVAAALLLTVFALPVLIRTAGNSAPAHLVAACFVALVPVLQLGHSPSSRSNTQTFGHDLLTPAMIASEISEADTNAIWLAEDAVTDLMATAAGRARALQSDGVAAAWRQRGVLFAWPRAQSWLGARGVAFRNVDGQPGLARVTDVLDCRTVATSWRRLNDLSRTRALGIVAHSPEEAGPVTLYLGFDARPDIQPLDWPTPRHRGLYAEIYALGDPNHAAALQRALADDGLGPDMAGAERYPFVARLELWRPPQAPMALTADLGRAPLDGVARVVERASPRRLTVCPVDPFQVRTFRE